MRYTGVCILPARCTVVEPCWPICALSSLSKFTHAAAGWNTNMRRLLLNRPFSPNSFAHTPKTFTSTERTHFSEALICSRPTEQHWSDLYKCDPRHLVMFSHVWCQSHLSRCDFTVFNLNVINTTQMSLFCILRSTNGRKKTRRTMMRLKLLMCWKISLKSQNMLCRYHPALRPQTLNMLTTCDIQGPLLCMWDTVRCPVCSTHRRSYTTCIYLENVKNHTIGFHKKL